MFYIYIHTHIFICYMFILHLLNKYIYVLSLLYTYIYSLKLLKTYYSRTLYYGNFIKTCENYMILAKIMEKSHFAKFSNFNSCKNWKDFNPVNQFLKKSINLHICMTLPFIFVTIFEFYLTLIFFSEI